MNKKVVIFANIMPTDDKNDLTVDLMGGHLEQALLAMIDFLFIYLVKWSTK